MIMGLKFLQTIRQTKHPSSHCSVCLYCFQAQVKESFLLKKNFVLKTGNEKSILKVLGNPHWREREKRFLSLPYRDICQIKISHFKLKVVLILISVYYSILAYRNFVYIQKYFCNKYSKF